MVLQAVIKYSTWILQKVLKYCTQYLDTSYSTQKLFAVLGCFTRYWIVSTVSTEWWVQSVLNSGYQTVYLGISQY